jgi:hypothetical protein
MIIAKTGLRAIHEGDLGLREVPTAMHAEDKYYDNNVLPHVQGSSGKPPLILIYG